MGTSLLDFINDLKVKSRMMAVQLRMFKIAVAAVLVTLSLVLVSGQDGTCRDFVESQCTIQEDNIFETVHTANIDECQFFCHVVYTAEQCKFFYFDKKENICNILKTDTAFSECLVFAGPDKPSVEECSGGTDDPCEVS